MTYKDIVTYAEMKMILRRGVHVNHDSRDNQLISFITFLFLSRTTIPCLEPILGNERRYLHKFGVCQQPSTFMENRKHRPVLRIFSNNSE